MNILFINTSRIWGGNEKWTQMATQELSKRHNVSLAYRTSLLGEKFDLDKFRLPFLNKFDIYTLYNLKKIIADRKIDMLISTNRKFFLLGAIAAALTGCKHFVRCGIVWHVPDTFYYRRLFQTHIHGIIVNAHAVKNSLLKSGVIEQKKIHVIYNGLDTSKLDQTDIPERSASHPFTVVSMGELVPRKGHDLIIKAFAGFLDKHPESNARLVLLGKGKQEKELKHLSSKLGIQTKVEFTGFLNNPYPVLVSADIMVSASQNEGISNAVLEAMYLGIPVISTPAGGIEETIDHGKNGFLFTQGDSKELADLMDFTFQTRGNHLRSIGKKAQKTVTSNFSSSKMGDELEKALEMTIPHNNQQANTEKS